MTLTITEYKPRNLRHEFTQEEMQAAFDRVKNSKHWKNPINRVITIKDDQEYVLIGAAVAHFTGSPVEFTPQPNGKVRVTAPGYYVCIGS